MRTLFLILVLSLTALASASAAGMSRDHAGGPAPAAMAAMDGHDCPPCPDAAMGDPAGHGACADCAACSAVGRDASQPAATPVAMTFSRIGNLRVTRRPAGRIDTEDPPPPRS